jgi:beta-lactam-binding protein with PASTA domain
VIVSWIKAKLKWILGGVLVVGSAVLGFLFFWRSGPSNGSIVEQNKTLTQEKAQRELSDAEAQAEINAKRREEEAAARVAERDATMSDDDILDLHTR